MTELTVGYTYCIVFDNCILPEEFFCILKEKRSRQYIPHEYRKCIAFEPDYEIITDYLFIDNANPNNSICIEDWEIKCGVVEIFSTEIPIK